MNKKLAIILIVVAFIAGAVAAGGSVGYLFVQRLVIMNKILDYQFECQPELSTSLVSISALKKFRSNETSNSNAVEYLELQLDYSVAGLGRYVGHLPLSERDSDSVTMKVLRSAKKYREQFPHTNQDVLIQKDIERAFSLVNEQNTELISFTSTDALARAAASAWLHNWEGRCRRPHISLQDNHPEIWVGDTPTFPKYLGRRHGVPPIILCRQITRRFQNPDENTRRAVF
jgi:hypothetical protein